MNLEKEPRETYRAIRILIVDDDSINHAVVLHTLKKYGIACDFALSGLEAVDATNRIDYDLVLMDREMPGIDGLEATRQIRSRESGYHHLPVMALSGGENDEDALACEMAGMDGYLVKPICEIDLLHAIRNVTRRINPVFFPTIHELQEKMSLEYDAVISLLESFGKRIISLSLRLELAAARNEAVEIENACGAISDTAMRLHLIQFAAVANDIEKSMKNTPHTRSRIQCLIATIEEFFDFFKLEKEQCWYAATDTMPVLSNELRSELLEYFERGDLKAFGRQVSDMIEEGAISKTTGTRLLCMAEHSQTDKLLKILHGSQDEVPSTAHGSRL